MAPAASGLPIPLATMGALATLKRKDLQMLCMERGIKANGKVGNFSAEAARDR
jgi:hypothetical protein